MQSLTIVPSSRPSQQQQLSGIPENQTFGARPSDGATGEVRRLLAETELLLQDAQAADDRSKCTDTVTSLENVTSLGTSGDWARSWEVFISQYFDGCGGLSVAV